MVIADLKEYFEKAENPKFYLTDVFSWRGCYDEVAFIPSKNGSKEDSLRQIDRALTETFDGWKGGEYTYEDYTDAHFETEERGYSDMALYNLLLKD
nr:MAG TPA: hypothetical protein [Caudoviricetes sp.]